MVLHTRQGHRRTTLTCLRCIAGYPFSFPTLYLPMDSPTCPVVMSSFLRSDTTSGLTTSPPVLGRTYGNSLQTFLHTMTTGMDVHSLDC